MTSDTSNKYYLGFFLALAAGLIWSFGAPTIRYMIDAQIYQWHYLFCRGIMVATVLVIFLLYKEGLAFHHNFRRVGLSGLIGGVGLAFAFIFFVGMLTTRQFVELPKQDIYWAEVDNNIEYFDTDFLTFDEGYDTISVEEFTLFMIEETNIWDTEDLIYFNELYENTNVYEVSL